jgi:hypothetical protein
MDNNCEAFSLGVSVTSEVRVAAQIRCFDSQHATQLETDLKALIDEARTGLQNTPMGTIPGTSIGPQNAIELVNSIQLTRSDERVDVRVTVPRAITDELQSLMNSKLSGTGMPGSNPAFPPTR